jgi:hypothetical protein
MWPMTMCTVVRLAADGDAERGLVLGDLLQAGDAGALGHDQADLVIGGDRGDGAQRDRRLEGLEAA